MHHMTRYIIIQKEGYCSDSHLTTGADGRFVNLIEEILIQIDVFWKDKAISHYQLEESEVLEFKASIVKSSFRFSAMFRSYIPKPNQPGILRPITQNSN